MFDAYRKRLNLYGKTPSKLIQTNITSAMDSHIKESPNYIIAIVNGVEYDARLIQCNPYGIDSNMSSYYLHFRSDVRFNPGQHVMVPDIDGNYEPWIIVATSDDRILPKYYAIKCNYTLRWIDTNGQLVEQPCIIYTRYSASAGFNGNSWMQFLENQIYLWISTNDCVQRIQYGDRFLVTNNHIHPTSYKITKIEDVIRPGLTIFTMLTDETSIYDNFDLLVADYYKKIGHIEIRTSDIKLYVGEKSPIKTQILRISDVTEERMDDQKIQYESLNQDIAVVDQHGYVTGVAEGTSSIRIICAGIEQLISITVLPVSQINILITGKPILYYNSKSTYQIEVTEEDSKVSDYDISLTDADGNPTSLAKLSGSRSTITITTGNSAGYIYLHCKYKNSAETKKIRIGSVL